MKAIVRAAIAALTMAAAAAEARIFPEVVPELDLARYAGTWYEVASTKPFFQRDCVCVTATYSIRPDGKVGVQNACRKGSPDGVLDIADGTATASSNPAKFTVNFGGFNFPVTNYWVVDLADDYSYAVVSTPFRRPIWILSRTPELAPDVLDGIIERLGDAGFPTRAISPTLQEGCAS